jgi:hypothetical protein
VNISNIPIERLLIGSGAAVLGLLVTFGLPVSPRRVKQAIPSILAIVLFFAGAISLLDWPTWLIAGSLASILAIIYRDIARFIKHAYYDVTKYSRRDYWYRRVGEAIIGNKRTRKRKR